jgi:hypothetical protein
MPLNLVKAMTAILVAEDDPGICDFPTDERRDEDLLCRL